MILKLKKFKIKTSTESSEINTLRAGDIVRRQYIDNNKSIYSLMYVEEVGVDKINTENGERVSHYFIGLLLYGDEPKTDELLNFVRVTSLSDRDRSGAIYMTSNGDNSPFLDVIEATSPNNAMFFPDNILDFSKPTNVNINFDTVNRGFKFTNAGGVDVSFKSDTIKNNTKFAMVYFDISSSKLCDVDVSIGGFKKVIKSTKDIQHIFIPVATDDLDSQFTIDFISKDLKINGDSVSVSNMSVFSIETVNGLVNATKTRVGKLDGIVDDSFGDISGYGGYFQKLYATKDVNISGTFTAGNQDGFGSVFYVGKISTNLIENSTKLTQGANKAKETSKSIVGIGNSYEVTGTISDFIIPTDKWKEDHLNERLCFSLFVHSNSKFSVELNGVKLEYGATSDWVRVIIPVFLTKKGNLTVKVNGKGTLYTAPQLEVGNSATLYQPTDGKLSISDKYGMWASEGGFGGTIQNPLLTINADGNGAIESKNSGFKINADGSGHLGGGALTFDKKSVKISFKDSNLNDEIDGKIDGVSEELNGKIDNATAIAKDAQDKIERLEIGGRNLLALDKRMKGVFIFQNSPNYLAINENSQASSYVINVVGMQSISVSISADSVFENNRFGLAFYKEFKHGDLPLSIPFNFQKGKPDADKYENIEVPKGATIAVLYYSNVGIDNMPTKIKLEKGNKATDWTPAPEDQKDELDKQITSVRTDFDIREGQISANVAKTEQLVNTTTELVEETKEISAGIKVTADKVESQAKEVSQKADEVKENATNVSQTAGSVNVVASEVKKDKEEVSEMKSSVEITAKGVNSTAEDVNNAKTEIDQTAEKINQTAKKTETDASKAQQSAIDAQKKADEAKASSGASSEAYLNAQKEADRAKLEAEKAQASQKIVTEKETSINQTAESINLTAKEVSSNAEKAQSEAEKAQSEAEKAKTNSDLANKKALEAQANADKTKADATASNQAKIDAQKKADEAKLQADKANQEAIKAKNDADKAKEAKEASEGVLQSVTEKEASINVTAGQVDIKAKEATESANRAVVAETNINTKADSIVMEASKQSAEKAIEGLEIGGRNRIYKNIIKRNGGDTDFNSWLPDGSLVLKKMGGTLGIYFEAGDLKLTSTNNLAILSFRYRVLKNIIKVLGGHTDYLFSRNSVYLDGLLQKGTFTQAFDTPQDNEWHDVKVYFDLNISKYNPLDRLFIQPNRLIDLKDNNGDIEINNLMFIIGNKPADYMLAPEDIDAQFQATNSKLELLSDQFSVEVAKTDGTQKELTLLKQDHEGFKMTVEKDIAGAIDDNNREILSSIELKGDAVLIGGETISLVGKVSIGMFGETVIENGKIRTDILETKKIVSEGIEAKDVNALTLTVNKGTIGGWKIDAAKIYSSNGFVHLKNTGEISNRDKWSLNSDGSGYLANKNILWDTAGKIKFGASVQIGFDNLDNTIVEGAYIKTSRINADEIVTNDAIIKNLNAKSIKADKIDIDSIEAGSIKADKIDISYIADNTMIGNGFVFVDSCLISQYGVDKNGNFSTNWGLFKESKFRPNLMLNGKTGDFWSKDGTMTNCYVGGVIIEKPNNVIGTTFPGETVIDIKKGLNINLFIKKNTAEANFFTLKDSVRNKFLGCRIKLQKYRETAEYSPEYEGGWTNSNNLEPSKVIGIVKFPRGHEINSVIKGVALPDKGYIEVTPIKRSDVLVLYPDGEEPSYENRESVVAWNISNISTQAQGYYNTLTIEDDKAELNGYYFYLESESGVLIIPSLYLDTFPIKNIIFNNKVSGRKYKLYSDHYGKQITLTNRSHQNNIQYWISGTRYANIGKRGYVHTAINLKNEWYFGWSNSDM